MKITKILYVAAISAGLFLSSCSMNKDASNTSYLQSGKLTAEQQLVSNTAQKQPLAIIDASQNQKVVGNDIVATHDNSECIQVPTVKKYNRSFVKNNFIEKTGIRLAQTITLPKASEAIKRLVEKPSYISSANKNPFAGMNYLVMWIICLVVAAVCLLLLISL